MSGWAKRKRKIWNLIHSTLESPHLCQDDIFTKSEPMQSNLHQSKQRETPRLNEIENRLLSSASPSTWSQRRADAWRCIHFQSGLIAKWMRMRRTREEQGSISSIIYHEVPCSHTWYYRYHTLMHFHNKSRHRGSDLNPSKAAS